MFDGSKISPLLAPTLTRISAALTTTEDRRAVATTEKSIVSFVDYVGVLVELDSCLGQARERINEG